MKQDVDPNVGGGKEKEGKCMFGNSCDGVYCGVPVRRDVVDLQVPGTCAVRCAVVHMLMYVYTPCK